MYDLTVSAYIVLKVAGVNFRLKHKSIFRTVSFLKVSASSNLLKGQKYFLRTTQSKNKRNEYFHHYISVVCIFFSPIDCAFLVAYEHAMTFASRAAVTVQNVYAEAKLSAERHFSGDER